MAHIKNEVMYEQNNRFRIQSHKPSNKINNWISFFFSHTVIGQFLMYRLFLSKSYVKDLN